MAKSHHLWKKHVGGEGSGEGGSVATEASSATGSPEMFSENTDNIEHRHRTSWFKSIDVDGSGSLSLEEIAAEYRKFDPDASEDEIDDMFREADADGSGELSLDEVSMYSISP